MNKVRHFIYDDQDTTFFIARELVRILVLASSNTLRLEPARCHQVDREDKKEDGKSSEASFVICAVHIVKLNSFRSHLHAEEKEYTIITENEVVFRRQACVLSLAH